MKKLMIVLFCIALTGCNWIVYRQNVEQGNIITPDMTAQLQIGMTPQQVRYIMGNPVLAHSFDINRWDYIYTLRKGSHDADAERITLYFTDGRLVRIGPVEKYKVPTQNRNWF